MQCLSGFELYSRWVPLLFALQTFQTVRENQLLDMPSSLWVAQAVLRITKFHALSEIKTE